MSPYTSLCANVLFPLHERLKGHRTAGAMREFMRSQWLEPQALAALQLQRLRDLLEHSRDHVPYYRDLFERVGLRPEALASAAELAKLPLLTKHIIRAEFGRLTADDASGFRVFSTTGSTGDPLRFGLGKLRVSYDVAAKWRATKWWGVDIGDPEIVAWSSPIELSTQDRVRRVRDKIFRSKLLATISLSPERLDALIDEIRRFEPRMLYGYPSSIALIAQRARARGIRLDDLGVRVVFTTAERLYPHQRSVISEAFGCPVADGYGGRDSGFIASECPEGQLHVAADYLVVEVVDDGGNPLPPGEAGEVVVTHLFSHDFPLIRYRTGDVAVLDDQRCPCGRGLPLMREVKGRTNDFLIAADGAKVHGVAFAMVLRDMPGMQQFKIVQESLERTQLQLVVDPEFRVADARPKLEATFRHFLGADLRLEIEIVDAIVPERSGKYRYVVTRVPESAAAPPAGADTAARSGA